MNEHETIISSYLYPIHVPTHSHDSAKSKKSRLTHLTHHPYTKKFEYWCVLRRNQFSYYKGADEREAVFVIPRNHLLNYKIFWEKLELSLYTVDTTLTFKFPDRNVGKKWDVAWKEFFKDIVPSKVSMERQEEWNTGQENLASISSSSSSSDDTVDTHIDGEEREEIDQQRKCCVKKSKEECEKVTPEDDTLFYKTFDPRLKEHIIQKGILNVKTKKAVRVQVAPVRFHSNKWKRFKVELSNRYLKIYSVKSGKLKKNVDLNNVIDSVELNNNNKDETNYVLDTCFAVITINERIKFKANNEKEMIDWIISLKSGILIRKKIMDS
ncbi:Opy1p NDAI_0A08150 [Naumovozyma dairenensis CBS 421]|uniref:PH domain-containing protein n=1 Tax=Naumovozyma dairenensis (strain ATCC 10597 / BCRC 20456 / CBS 421 / NBRC 0211 / NRRL Y-12639) TaxID=1071378 RepID=G0W581_NAUDC|nr:hypothetical protein NDAI_0A08150 [Naumovozyma dairenensis CBS 421]CCD22969.1 hypothetical protein NDAI_0A08150 [Naumovozyma dairenensis CBS 421]